MAAYGTIASGSQIDPAVEMLLREYSRDRLYGSVEIKFEAGRVVLIRKIESIKPAGPNNGEKDELES